ncbi:hypothetical protein ABUL39_11485 [Rhodothermus marinus]|uniref:hypothetical protein n=1 Tax=Rhodothermus marinus TaxID=29549 RepID=UPI0037C59B5D
MWYQKLFAASALPADTPPSFDTRLVAVYIGSPTCGPSNHPNLPALLRTIRTHLQDYAEAHRQGVHFVGVAISRLPTDGLKHLERMGPFDEVAAGGRWHSLAFRGLRAMLGGAAATPQLVLYLDAEGHTRLLLRLVGVDRIRQWVQAGMPLAAPDTLVLQQGTG